MAAINEDIRKIKIQIEDLKTKIDKAQEGRQGQVVRGKIANDIIVPSITAGQVLLWGSVARPLRAVTSWKYHSIQYL